MLLFACLVGSSGGVHVTPDCWQVGCRMRNVALDQQVGSALLVWRRFGARA